MIDKLGILFVITVVLSGCATAPAPVIAPLNVQKFNAPIDIELRAETGDTVFVEGEFIDGEYIKINVAHDLMIPGSMFIPFPVHVAKGDLVLKRIDRDWKYFCGDLNESTASFPGLGTVVKSGDCIGIRVSRIGETSQWVVDNSIHNRGMQTIWTSNLALEDHQKYQPKKSGIPFNAKVLTRITFDGYYSNQLHFTWQESNGKDQDTRNFVFDFSGKPTLIGIKGKHFEALQADNVVLKYRWKKF